MKDLLDTIQKLRALLAGLNLDCNVIEVGFGNNYLRFTWLWESPSGPRTCATKVLWSNFDLATAPETILHDVMENFRKHQQQTLT